MQLINVIGPVVAIGIAVEALPFANPEPEAMFNPKGLVSAARGIGSLAGKARGFRGASKAATAVPHSHAVTGHQHQHSQQHLGGSTRAERRTMAKQQRAMPSPANPAALEAKPQTMMGKVGGKAMGALNTFGMVGMGVGTVQSLGSLMPGHGSGGAAAGGAPPAGGDPNAGGAPPPAGGKGGSGGGGKGGSGSSS